MIGAPSSGSPDEEVAVRTGSCWCNDAEVETKWTRALFVAWGCGAGVISSVEAEVWVIESGHVCAASDINGVSILVTSSHCIYGHILTECHNDNVDVIYPPVK